MKYAGKQIRAWIVQTLTGMSVDGVTIPVYNLPDMDAEPPYLLIVNQTQNQTESKDSDCATGTVMVQCVTKFVGDQGGEAFADSMASKVSDLLTDAETVTQDFKVAVLSMDVNEGTSIINQTERVIVRQLTFRLLISERLDY